MRMESSVTIKGQITLPAVLRKRFGLHRGRKVMFAETQEGILVKPAKLVDETKGAAWKKALADSIAQAEAGKGHYFANDEELIGFLEKETRRVPQGKKAPKRS